MNSNTKYSEIYTIVLAAKNRSDDLNHDNPWNLREVNGDPLLYSAIKSKVVNPENLVVGILNSEDLEYKTSDKLLEYLPNAQFVRVSDGLPGALITSLLCLENIPADFPIVITTGDSTQNFPMGEVVKSFLESNCDAGAVCFKSQNSRFSYLRVNVDGEVTQVAEKLVIGDLATTGTYFFRNTAVFMDAAKWCLVNNIRTDGKFFVSASLNFMINCGMKISYFEIEPSSYTPTATEKDLELMKEKLGEV
jgi:dTDP-glucose pyrophosphorylase